MRKNTILQRLVKSKKLRAYVVIFALDALYALYEAEEIAAQNAKEDEKEKHVDNMQLVTNMYNELEDVYGKLIAGEVLEGYGDE